MGGISSSDEITPARSNISRPNVFFVFFAGHNCYIRATTVYIVVLVAASQGHRQVEPPSCKLVRKAPLINLLLAIESFK